MAGVAQRERERERERDFIAGSAGVTGGEETCSNNQ